MTLYIIAIGGTGARCVEAVTQCAAAGLYTEEPIKILFVDADESNGNLSRTTETIKTYQECHQLVKNNAQTPWLQTPIELLSFWSPFSNSTNKTLGSFLNYNSYKNNHPALGHLFDVLYTKDEREAPLDVGFRGRPAIGSAIISQVNFDESEQEPWATLIKLIRADLGTGKSVNIFLCGSIFGGTGASGFPTIGRLLVNKLSRLEGRDRLKIGGLLMLPYFAFLVPNDRGSNEIHARADQFLLNTESALRYYVNEAQSTFDAVYMLGNQNPTNVKFSIGKNSQSNEPHFIELYAALAAKHFLGNSASGETGKVILIGRASPGRITWKDLPDSEEVKQKLVNTTRFAFAWMANLVPELAYASKVGVKKFQDQAPWFSSFFRPEQGFLGKMIGNRQMQSLPEFNELPQQEAIETIKKWCNSYLRWLNKLHFSGDNIELFKPEIFGGGEGRLSAESFAGLVFDDSRDKDKRSLDTIQLLKEKLDGKIGQPGTVGLANSLYLQCKP